MPPNETAVLGGSPDFVAAADGGGGGAPLPPLAPDGLPGTGGGRAADAPAEDGRVPPPPPPAPPMPLPLPLVARPGRLARKDGLSPSWPREAAEGVADRGVSECRTEGVLC